MEIVAVKMGIKLASMGKLGVSVVIVGIECDEEILYI